MKIFINHPPGDNGGPAVFVKKFAKGLKKYDISLEFHNKKIVNAALLMINSQGLIPYFQDRGIKVGGRTSGFYIPEYWHNKTPDRMLTQNKIGHNNNLANDLKKYDHMIYQSNWSKLMCDQYLFHRESNFSIIHNGAEISSQIKKNNSVIKLLVLGNLRHSYTVDCPLFAFNQLKNSYNLELIFVGKVDDICKNKLQAIQPEKIKYLGQKPYESLRDIYQNCDILLHCRQGDVCPNVVVEAMANGLAVIGADWGGSKELIGNGGEVVMEKNKWEYSQDYNIAFAKALEKVLLNLDSYKNNAYLRAQHEFSVDKMTRQYISILLPDYKI